MKASVFRVGAVLAGACLCGLVGCQNTSLGVGIPIGSHGGLGVTVGGDGAVGVGVGAVVHGGSVGGRAEVGTTWPRPQPAPPPDPPPKDETGELPP